jgi:RecB family exonuclease
MSDPLPSARRLAVFVAAALRYAASPSEDEARRLIAAPFSSVPRADARALLVAAGEHGNLLDAIDTERVPLGHERLVATRRFAKALRELARLTREGVAENELEAAVHRVFELDSSPERPSTEPPAPLGPYAAESPHAVKRRSTHFSASSLGTYAECERKWYYRYVCSAVEDKGSSASFYGTAFHWALERFHQEFPRADAASAETLATKLDGWIQTAFERYRSGFDTNVEYELQTRRARRTGRKYLEWFLERSRAHPFSVIGAEEAAELELEGYQFIGYIDRLDRDDATGAVTVVDYKTGSIAESASEYREDVAQFVDFQLPFYYWARTAKGDRVTRLSLLPLKDALRDVEPVELEVVPVAAPAARGSDATVGTIGIDELERARAKMVELARRLSDEPLESFAVTDEPDACTFCAYQNACRLRPLRREDRFGR